ncbi:MAG: putative Na+/H+ antiporter [Opitutus sp.]|nr:putative Na+/H+ antiporter [Opitutus sp.]
MAPQSGQLPDEAEVEERHSSHARAAIPGWVTAVHLVALGWTVFTAHYTVLFMGGFLVFLAFSQATRHHQDPINLRTPVLVGFFLAGLVIHGTLQQWWIAPVLGSLSELPLMLGAIGLTAFNDNAAITYLASLVPNFSDELKYAVMAGAVAGGGLTVIANAPNPAGQSILSSCFGGGISPLKLLLGALVPTVIMTLCFLLLPSV